MAQLIPAVLDENAPPGERRVFDFLAKGPADWTALHSLDLAPWDGNRRTEIDFLVIIPDTGIVCVEVKSHKIIEFDGTQWRPPGIRDPFKQALDAAKGFHRRLRKERQFDRIPVVHLCVFPESPFRPERNWSKADGEFIDGVAFSGCRQASEFCELIRTKARSQISEDPQISPLARDLLKPVIQKLVEMCHPIRTRSATKREELAVLERQLEDLLHDQQKPVLNLLKHNQRVLVTGPAGTGKTFVAMEAAVQKSREGKRVGLICFNKMVAAWMRQTLAAQGRNPANLIVETVHALLKNLVGIEVPEKPLQKFWDAEFPEQVIARLTDPEEDFSCSFDYLVIDEAQDLISRPELLECLFLCLEGGRATGSFMMLGDLQYQVLRHGPISDETVKQQAGHDITRFALDENCRNLKKVGRTAVRLSGLAENIYSLYRRGDGRSENFDYYSYSDDSQQAHLIQQKLLEFKKKGYKESETTILSFRKQSAGIGNELKKLGVSFGPPSAQTDRTVLTSVDSFKGLENINIILADVKPDRSEEMRNLFYTGMTRSKENLCVLVDRATEDLLDEWL